MATTPKDTTKETKAPVKEALVVFSNLISASGPRIRASVFAEGKVKGATAPMTTKGINRLREWAKKIAGTDRLAEMVNVSEAGVLTTKLEEKMIQEATKVVALEPGDQMARKLAHASFPEYTGRKFKVEVRPEGSHVDVTSYWDGGSRDYYVILNLVTMKSAPVPQNGDAFTARKIAPVTLHENLCVVNHAIYMGKDMGLTFIISEKNAAQLLPANDNNLDKKEKTVLVLLRSFKPAYRRDEARHAGISATDYDTIIANLKVKQYVNPSGAITAKGKNAISDIRDLYQLRNESVKKPAKVVEKVNVLQKEDAAPSCDKCDRTHPADDACAGEVKEAVLRETLLHDVTTNTAYTNYVAYLALSGYKLMRHGGSGSNLSADFNISGVGDLYIKGKTWEIQGHIKGTRINPSGDTLESLEKFLYDNNI